MPHVITGSLATQNRQAIDWGCQGFVAYGCQTFVVVVYPEKPAEIQTLVGHAQFVTKVRWSRENFSHDRKANSYQLCLASADSAGVVIIWDINSGTQKSSFTENGKQIVDMRWSFQDFAKDFIAVLHSPSILAVWNADSGTKIWRQDLGNVPFQSFDCDPFMFNRVALLTSSGSVLLINDFSLTKPPSTTANQQFKMTNLHSDSTPISTLEESKRGSLTEKFIRKPFMQVFGGGIEKLRQEASVSGQTDSCLEILFHPAARNRLLLVYSRETLFLDLQSMQTVSQIFPSSQRDAVYFVQENGCITLRLMRWKPEVGSVSSVQSFTPIEVLYEALCSSDNIRMTKTYRLSGVCLDPISQRKLCLLMSTGRCLFYELLVSNSKEPNDNSLQNRLTLSGCVETKTDHFYPIQNPVGKLKFILSAIHHSLGMQPTVIRTAPSVSHPGKQIAAVGTTEGCIQLIDLISGVIEKDFAIHQCPINCLEWSGSMQVVSAGHTQTLSSLSSIVRNELYHTDVRTGASKVIRPEADESPIELIRVSHYGSYLAVAFKEQPLEIYDLKSFRLLRKMARTCPVIVDMAWSSKHNQARNMKKTGSYDEAELDILQSSDSSQTTIFRENLVVLDNENRLFHVIVKGIHVRDGKEVNTQWTTNSLVTSMVWKDDFLAFGDSEGKISTVGIR